MRRNENNRDVEARVPKLLLKIQAVDSGKSYIQDQATGTIEWLSL